MSPPGTTCPISSEGNADPMRPLLRKLSRRVRSHGAENLVIVAAGHEPCRAAPDRQSTSRLRGRRERDLAEVDGRGDAARPHHLGEIAREAVGHVHGGAGMVAQDRPPARWRGCG